MLNRYDTVHIIVPPNHKLLLLNNVTEEDLT